MLALSETVLTVMAHEVLGGGWGGTETTGYQ